MTWLQSDEFFYHALLESVKGILTRSNPNIRIFDVESWICRTIRLHRFVESNPRFDIEYSNIWQIGDAEKVIWEGWGCTGWTRKIFEIATAECIDKGGELVIRSYSVVESEWNGISDIGKDGIWAVLYPFNVSWGWEGFQQVLPWNRILTSSAKLTLRDRRNRLSMESVESVECLHNWLLSGIIDGVLTQMDVSALMDLDEWAKKSRFSGVDDVARRKGWFYMWFWWFR